MQCVEVALEAARAGADVLMTHFGGLGADDVQTKTKNDFVSFVDSESEKAIRRVILGAFPHHQFLGEEHGMVGDESGWRWIVDPLDGTSNYVTGVPQFSISIALHQDGCPTAAVVLDPVRDEAYCAERGAGAWRNGERVQVANDRSMADSLVGTGFPFRHHEVLDDYVATFREVLPRSAGVRRMGSAALDLSYVASGALGGFWEFLLSPWDIAAGALLIEEAGGVMSDFAGADNYLDSGNVVAGSPVVHRELLAIVQGALRKRGVPLS